MPKELEQQLEKQRRLVAWLGETHGGDDSTTRQTKAVLEEMEREQRVRVHHRRRNAALDGRRSFPLSKYLEDVDPGLRPAKAVEEDHPSDDDDDGWDHFTITAKEARLKTRRFYRISPDPPPRWPVPVKQRADRLWSDGRAQRLLLELDEPALPWEELWDRFCAEFHARHPRLAERYGVPAPATRRSRPASAAPCITSWSPWRYRNGSAAAACWVSGAAASSSRSAQCRPAPSDRRGVARPAGLHRDAAGPGPCGLRRRRAGRAGRAADPRRGAGAGGASTTSVVACASSACSSIPLGSVAGTVEATSWRNASQPAVPATVARRHPIDTRVHR